MTETQPSEQLPPSPATDEFPSDQFREDGTPIPGTPAANDLVKVGRDGDPLPDDRSVAMTERESYERVIEGLKIAADAAAHLWKRTQGAEKLNWMAVASYLDQVRRAATQQAGLEDTIKLSPTERMRGEPMLWAEARNRFRYGCTQAAGGMRQMATCHRANIAFSKGAHELEEMARKTLTILTWREPIIRPGKLRKDGLVEF